VYPYIDPKPLYASRAFKGKVVLITGASRGIGQETALYYAKAGASLVLVSRKQGTLDETKAAILKEVPDAEVLTFTADVKDPTRAEEAVKAATDRFGKLDVLIANAGASTSFEGSLVEKDANDWWNTMEINVRGVYNYLRAGIPSILKSKGSIIVITTGMAQLRILGTSDYSVSKFTLGRLIEFAALEYPELRIFAIHPGLIATSLASDAGAFTLFQGMPLATLGLPAATMLTLSAGKAEWLRGRFWSSNWDLEEGEKNWKTKVLENNGLVNKLNIP
ncbi:NAD-P-binding protein, partial [Gloeopeniophorella convolvens]